MPETDDWPTTFPENLGAGARKVHAERTRLPMTVERAVRLGNRWALAGSPNHQFSASSQAHVCRVCGASTEGIQHTG